MWPDWLGGIETALREWGYGEPFNRETYAVDVVRCVVLGFAVALIWNVVKLSRRAGGMNRRLICISLACFGAASIYTETRFLGTPLTVKLPLVILGTVFGTIGVVKSNRLMDLRDHEEWERERERVLRERGYGR